MNFEELYRERERYERFAYENYLRMYEGVFDEDSKYERFAKMYGAGRDKLGRMDADRAYQEEVQALEEA